MKSFRLSRSEREDRPQTAAGCVLLLLTVLVVFPATVVVFVKLTPYLGWLFDLATLPKPVKILVGIVLFSPTVLLGLAFFHGVGALLERAGIPLWKEKSSEGASELVRVPCACGKSFLFSPADLTEQLRCPACGQAFAFPAGAAKHGDPAPAVPSGPSVVSILPAAAKAIQQIAGAERVNGPFWVRLEVHLPGGPETLRHAVDIDLQAPTADDRVFQSGGLSVVVRANQVEMLRGCTVDYVVKDVQAGFAVINPNFQEDQRSRWLRKLERGR